MDFLIAAVLGFLVYEIYAWQPRITTWLVARAIKSVDPAYQDRCREEWQAGIDELPNTVLRIVHAASLFAAAYRINHEIQDELLVQLNDRITGFKNIFSGRVRDFLEISASYRIESEKTSQALEDFKKRKKRARGANSNQFDPLFEVADRITANKIEMDDYFRVTSIRFKECEKELDAISDRYSALRSLGIARRLLVRKDDPRHLLDELHALAASMCDALAYDRLKLLAAQEEKLEAEMQAIRIRLTS